MMKAPKYSRLFGNAIGYWRSRIGNLRDDFPEHDEREQVREHHQPVEEIRENGYILSVNKYKEIDREKVSYEPSEIIFGRIIKTEDDIAAALMEFKEKYLK